MQQDETNRRADCDDGDDSENSGAFRFHEYGEINTALCRRQKIQPLRITRLTFYRRWRWCGLRFEPLRDVEFNRAVFLLINRDGVAKMNRKALRRVVRHDDALFEFQRLVENRAVKIRIHPEVNDDFVRRLRDAANIRVAAF